MERKSLSRGLWLAAQPILVYFGISVGAGVLISIVAVIPEIFSPGGNLSKLLLENLMWVQVVIQLLCLPAMWVLYRPRRAERPRYSHGVPRLAALPIVLGSVALWFIVSPMVDLLAPFFPSYDTVSEFMGDISIGLFLLSVGILAPLVEELCFRGIVYNSLRGSLPVLPAILVQALLFGLIHMNALQSIYATLVGLALGLLYARFPSLWVPILSHACFNLTNLFAGLFTGLTLLGSLLGGGAVLAICVLWLRKFPAPVPLPDSGFYCLQLNPKYSS